MMNGGNVTTGVAQCLTTDTGRTIVVTGFTHFPPFCVELNHYDLAALLTGGSEPWPIMADIPGFGLADLRLNRVDGWKHPEDDSEGMEIVVYTEYCGYPLCVRILCEPQQLSELLAGITVRPLVRFEVALTGRQNAFGIMIAESADSYGDYLPEHIHKQRVTLTRSCGPRG